ncbi:hypothetical protein [Ileibacterium valens]|uniref:hypothetical protein n=1 Tax=Ileibacterium valens TaxID=1862668 RepID=UPI00272C469B|nr:hypothetical protein [Ileibacterium valens]
MSIELAAKYSPKCDEVFTSESKSSLLTNTDYDWIGGNVVIVYKLATAKMNDYSRNVANGTALHQDTRYGNISDLDGSTEEMMLTKDRSFIFNVDKLDEDETAGAVNPAACLARQIREVVIPERDKYIYNTMAAKAGLTASAAKDGFKYYPAIIDATMAMDEAEVPDVGRVLILPAVGYAMLKRELNEVSYNSVDAAARMTGVIGYLDGMPIVKVPSSYLPENVAFMIAHPSATVAPVKLADYGLHQDTIYSSGTVATGRICYDAFVLDNKKKGIFVQKFA